MVTLDCELSYNPGEDRVVGGDYIRKVEEAWTSSILVPRVRCMPFVEKMKAFGDAYQRHFSTLDEVPPPYPCPVAVFELKTYPATVDGVATNVPVGALLNTPGLHLAPAVYGELTQVVCVVPSGERLVSVDAETIGDGFGPRLFRLIWTAHHCMNASLGRGSGSSLDYVHVSDTGGLLDLYFLTDGGPLSKDQFANRRIDDLTRGLELLHSIALGSADRLNELVQGAITSYCGPGKCPESLEQDTFDAVACAVKLRRRSPLVRRELRPIARRLDAVCQGLDQRSS